jgi:hypothetical protein
MLAHPGLEKEAVMTRKSSSEIPQIISEFRWYAGEFLLFSGQDGYHQSGKIIVAKTLRFF